MTKKRTAAAKKKPSRADKTPEKRSRKGTFLRIVGALIGVLLIAVLLYKTDIDSLLKQIGCVGWGFAGVLIVTFFTQLIAVYAWVLSFPQKLGSRTLPTLFGVRLVGESLAQINPTKTWCERGRSLQAIRLSHASRAR